MPSDSLSPCPACDSAGGRIVHRAFGVPVQSVRLLHDPDLARRFPTGDIALAFCPACGFIWNAVFDPQRLDYGLDYEATQAHSGIFDSFHRKLAAGLVERHGLAGKTVVEVGCGQGEFLELLCRSGAGRGIGIDPAYRAGAPDAPHGAQVEVHPEALAGRHRALAGDLVCCKMTLEHIETPAAFVRQVGGTLAGGPACPLFFQVPEVTRILRQGAFWDVYYEHCSYFSPGSLARLFRRAGARVTALWTDYDDQYLMIEADWPSDGGAVEPLAAEEPLPLLAEAVAAFEGQAADAVAAWRVWLEQESGAGRPVVLWGGSSRTVAYLSAMADAGRGISAVVDINPRKDGSYLPGSAQPVVGPAALPALDPASVVVMNPIYRSEVAATLADLGLTPDLLTVDRAPETAASSPRPPS